MREHSQLRRGVQYERWDKGDAEGLAPSLYARRNRYEALDAEGADQDPDLDIEIDAEGALVRSVCYGEPSTTVAGVSTGGLQHPRPCRLARGPSRCSWIGASL